MSNGEDPNQSIYISDQLDPDLTRDVVGNRILTYRKSAEGWLADDKRNLAESCLVVALQYIAKARSLGIAELSIDGNPEKIDSLEERIRAQLATIRRLN